MSALKAYPADLVRTVLIRTEGTSSQSDADKVDVTVVDQDGHAHEGYQVQKDELLVVVVRPDGAVGAIVRGPDGAKQYFGRFSACFRSSRGARQVVET